MNRTTFLGEFDQILRMLADHAYLQYAPSSQKEYEEKVTAAFSHFRSLISGATTIELSDSATAAQDLAALHTNSLLDAERILTREAGRLHASGKEQDSLVWREAAALLASLKR